MKKIVNIGRICMVPLLLVQIAFIILGPVLDVIDTSASSMVFMVTGLWAMIANVNLLNMCYRYMKRAEECNKQDIVNSDQHIEASRQIADSSSLEVDKGSNDIEASSQDKV